MDAVDSLRRLRGQPLRGFRQVDPLSGSPLSDEERVVA
jgi:hypothetical protein